MSGRQRVTAKQPNSKMCLVCGLQNHAGLQASFYELENDQVVGVFCGAEHHQGYPGRLHGGIAASMLDETIGRAIRMRHGDELWGVTIELKTRFRRPIPLCESVRTVGRITRETRRHFEGTGEILLPDDSIAVQGHGRYLKMSIDSISRFDFEEQQWDVVAQESDPDYVDVPVRQDNIDRP